MKISTKLQSGYLLVVLMMLVCAGAGYLGFVNASKQLDFISGLMKESNDSVKTLQLGLSEQMRLVDKLIFQGVNEEIVEQLHEIDKESMQALNRLALSPFLTRDSVALLEEQYVLLLDAKQHILAGNITVQVKEQYGLDSNQLSEAIRVLSGELDKEIKEKITEAQESRSLLQALILGCALFGLILSLVILAIVRLMVVWLQRLHITVTNLAQGDLSINFDEQEALAFVGDDLQDINRAMQSLLQRFSQVISDLTSNTLFVNEISKKMNHSATEISRGANEQASSLEETSASIEQMSATVSQNNHNASMTKDLANETARSAKTSGKTVFDMIEAMRHIAEKVSIIDDIAYQTNLLALNAAIEASRAGEEGRGFAVVATEVRKLAERSKFAASEVITLAKKTLQASEEAGKEFINILPNIERTAELVQEITAASDEQATGLQEITFAVGQLDNVAQYNAKAAHQLTAMADEMEDSVQQLAELIQFFKLKL